MKEEEAQLQAIGFIEEQQPPSHDPIRNIVVNKSADEDMMGSNPNDDSTITFDAPPSPKKSDGAEGHDDCDGVSSEVRVPEALQQVAAKLRMELMTSNQSRRASNDEDEEWGLAHHPNPIFDFDRSSTSSDGDIMGGSSITASEAADSQLISGWAELEQLESSFRGDSITIRLKVKEDDISDESDDSIQLDSQAYSDLMNLLRRAEASHKTLADRLEVSSTPNSDCGSLDTAVRSPMNKKSGEAPCRRPAASDGDSREKNSPSEPHLPNNAHDDVKMGGFSTIHSTHAQELLMFLKGKTSAPPGGGGSLKVEVVRGRGGGKRRGSIGSSSNISVSVSPPCSTTSTVIDNDFEMAELVNAKNKGCGGWEEKAPQRESNELVVVESKRTRKMRMKKEREEKSSNATTTTTKVVKFVEEGDTKSKPDETIECKNNSKDGKKEVKKFTAVGEKVVGRNPYEDLQKDEVVDGGAAAASRSAFVPVNKDARKSASSPPLKAFAAKVPAPSRAKSEKKRGRGLRKRGGDANLKFDELPPSVLLMLERRRKLYLLGLFIALTLAATFTLYLGGFHREAEGATVLATGIGAAAVTAQQLSKLAVEVLYPASGKIMSDIDEPISWKMSGESVVAGQEFHVTILVDGLEHSQHKFLLPDDTMDETVDGSLGLNLSDLSEEFARGSHNISVVCKSQGLESVGSSVFLYMPTGGVNAGIYASDDRDARQEKPGGPEADVALRQEDVKVSITQPLSQAVVNGDSVVMKFNAEGFDVDAHQKLIKIIMVLDGADYELSTDVNTLSGLTLGSHSAKVYVISRETMEILHHDEVSWENVKVATVVVGEGGDEGEKGTIVTVERVLGGDKKSVRELTNAALIELADAAGLESKARGIILVELEKRFEEFQQLYAIEKAREEKERNEVTGEHP